MKSAINLVIYLLVWSVALAQPPQGIPYQAVARNSSGAIMASTGVSIRFSIRDSVATGTILYRETFSVTTSAQGLFSVNIGQGTPVTGAFSGINWGTNSKFLQVELDPAGGSSYIDMGTTQMMSVPYALHSGSTSGILNWRIDGNTGLNSSANFIGTTDNVKLGFRVNNIPSGEINPTNHSVFLGEFAGANNTSGSRNIAIGLSALHTNATVNDLIAIGDSALFSQNGGSGWNVAVGSKALRSNTTGYNNTAIGVVALLSNTTGVQNTATGAGVLRMNTTGDNNTGSGTYSLAFNTTGYSNSAFGSQSLNQNTSGFNNTGIGTQSLYSNTTGNNNTAVGLQSLYFNSTGWNNTAIGKGSLNNNTTGYSNTACGEHSLYSNISGTQNTALGESSLFSNTTGRTNTAIGNASLEANTTGEGNTATGYLSLVSNTTGNSNVAIGSNSLHYNTTGSQNSAIGTASLNYNSIGVANTANGYNALYNNTTGSLNTATGANSLNENTTGNNNTAIGFRSLEHNTTGYQNTAIGTSSMVTNVTGNNNTSIGQSADVASGSLNNAMAIGNLSVVNSSNKAVIGNSSVTTIGGYANWSNLSDARFKTGISENVPGLEFIMKLRPVTYKFEARKFEKFLGRPDSLTQQLFNSYLEAEAQIRTGFIAQEVEQVANTIGYNFSGLHKPTNEKDNYSLAYAEFTVPIVKAIQEQQQKISDQQVLIERLLSEIRELKSHVIELEKMKQ